MGADRLTLAIGSGLLAIPASGRILVMGPGAGTDISALPRDRVLAVQPFRPDHDALAARGIAATPALPAEAFAAAVVFLPRSREAARDWIARAAAAVARGGPVAVDGQKTDGIDGLLRDLGVRVALSEPVVKAHGRLAVFAAGRDLSDWRSGLRKARGGFDTRPGVFSADGPDPGSSLLADALPARLPGRGLDLGAGWGFLARAALAREGVTALDLVEADAEALDCARANITDPRAAFHWADARCFRPESPADWVVANPPFHSGRATDPALGAAFIGAAARMLTPEGTLWLVANRPLPYDRVLAASFREVEDIGGNAAFRLTRAARPLPRPKGTA
ncbi:MAG TPA: methyltransferase [Paracoccaceae bacterium]|nr:methyltransferase [Paracoccaceae bacterium]HMO71073.1 methyltransferase [Paracoccaceae bacterium]